MIEVSQKDIRDALQYAKSAVPVLNELHAGPQPPDQEKLKLAAKWLRKALDAIDTDGEYT